MWYIFQVVLRDESLYTCFLCPNEEEKVTGDAKTIIAHMKDIHDIRLYICDVCGQDFRKRNELSLHLDDHVAKEEGDFQCEICNRIFSNLRLFRIHKRIHYPQVKSWPCNTCGKRYKYDMIKIKYNEKREIIYIFSFQFQKFVR